MNVLKLYTVTNATLTKVRNTAELSEGIILGIDATERSAQILESYLYRDALGETSYLHLEKTTLKMISKRYNLTSKKAFNLYIIKLLNSIPNRIAQIKQAQIITPEKLTILLFNICRKYNSKQSTKDKKQKYTVVGLLPNIEFRRRDFKWLN